MLLSVVLFLQGLAVTLEEFFSQELLRELCKICTMFIHKPAECVSSSPLALKLNSMSTESTVVCDQHRLTFTEVHIPLTPSPTGVPVPYRLTHRSTLPMDTDVCRSTHLTQTDSH